MQQKAQELETLNHTLESRVQEEIQKTGSKNNFSSKNPNLSL